MEILPSIVPGHMADMGISRTPSTNSISKGQDVKDSVTKDPSVARAFPRSASVGKLNVRTQLKAKLLESLYDVPDIGSEQADLTKKTFPLNISRKNHHPADDQVSEWMRAERRRAEERAERRWKKRFEDWQAAEKVAVVKRTKTGTETFRNGAVLAEHNKEQSTGGSSTKDVTDVPSAEEAQVSLEASREERSTLSQACNDLQAEKGQLLDELCREREQFSAMERQMIQACGERDAWRTHANRHESRLQQAANDRKVTSTRLANLGRLIDHLSLKAIGPQTPSKTKQLCSSVEGEGDLQGTHVGDHKEAGSVDEDTAQLHMAKTDVLLAELARRATAAVRIQAAVRGHIGRHCCVCMRAKQAAEKDARFFKIRRQARDLITSAQLAGGLEAAVDASMLQQESSKLQTIEVTTLRLQARKILTQSSLDGSLAGVLEQREGVKRDDAGVEQEGVTLMAVQQSQASTPLGHCSEGHFESGFDGSHADALENKAHTAKELECARHGDIMAQQIHARELFRKNSLDGSLVSILRESSLTAAEETEAKIMAAQRERAKALLLVASFDGSLNSILREELRLPQLAASLPPPATPDEMALARAGDFAAQRRYARALLAQSSADGSLATILRQQESLGEGEFEAQRDYAKILIAQSSLDGSLVHSLREENTLAKARRGDFTVQRQYAQTLLTTACMDEGLVPILRSQRFDSQHRRARELLTKASLDGRLVPLLQAEASTLAETLKTSHELRKATAKTRAAFCAAAKAVEKEELVYSSARSSGAGAEPATLHQVLLHAGDFGAQRDHAKTLIAQASLDRSLVTSLKAKTEAGASMREWLKSGDFETQRAHAQFLLTESGANGGLSQVLHIEELEEPEKPTFAASNKLSPDPVEGVNTADEALKEALDAFDAALLTATSPSQTEERRHESLEALEVAMQCKLNMAKSVRASLADSADDMPLSARSEGAQQIAESVLDQAFQASVPTLDQTRHIASIQTMSGSTSKTAPPEPLPKLRNPAFPVRPGSAAESLHNSSLDQRQKAIAPSVPQAQSSERVREAFLVAAKLAPQEQGASEGLVGEAKRARQTASKALPEVIEDTWDDEARWRAKEALEATQIHDVCDEGSKEVHGNVESEDEAKEAACFALEHTLKCGPEHDFDVDKTIAQLALEHAFKADEDTEVEVMKQRASHALENMLEDEDHEVDLVKRAARQALEDKLQDEDDDNGIVKRSARRALEDTFQDEDDDTDIVKQSAQQAVENKCQIEENDIDIVKRSAQQALEDTFLDEDDDIEKMKQRAQLAFDDTFKNEDYKVGGVKQTAQQALEDMYMDEEDNIDVLKQTAQQALEDTFHNADHEAEWTTAEAINEGYEADKVKEIEEVKRTAQLVLEQALHDDDKTDSEQATQEGIVSGFDEGKRQARETLRQTQLIDLDDGHEAQQQARLALEQAFEANKLKHERDEEVKQQARIGLEQSLMEDSGEQEKCSARLNLESTLGTLSSTAYAEQAAEWQILIVSPPEEDNEEEEEQEKEEEEAKEQARAALEDVLEADLHLKSGICENLDETTLLAQLALNRILEGDDEGQTKQEAQEAEVSIDAGSTEDVKQKARRLVEESLLEQLVLNETLEDGDEQTRKDAQEVTNPSMDAGSLEEVKQAARTQLEESLLPKLTADEVMKSDGDEQTKQGTQEAVEASMAVGSLENVTQEARRDLQESLHFNSEAHAKLMAQDAMDEASEARSGASESITHTRYCLDSLALRRKAAVALIKARRQGLMATVLRRKALPTKAVLIEGEETGGSLDKAHPATDAKLPILASPLWETHATMECELAPSPEVAGSKTHTLSGLRRKAKQDIAKAHRSGTLNATLSSSFKYNAKATVEDAFQFCLEKDDGDQRSASDAVEETIIQRLYSPRSEQAKHEAKEALEATLKDLSDDIDKQKAAQTLDMALDAGQERRMEAGTQES